MLLEQLKDDELFSYQEKMIRDYILSNPKKILKMKTNDLAAVTYTSTSCVTRFCKKVGSKSFPDFKIEFAIEYTYSLREGAVDEKPLRKEMTTQEILDVLPNVYDDTYLTTKKLLNENTINRVVNYMRHAKRVDIYGESVNFYIAQKASFSLQTIGINAYAYSVSNEDYLLRQSNEKDFVYSIIISHSGENQSMLKIAKRLHDYHLKSVVLVGVGDSDIAHYCDDELLFSSSSIAFDLYPLRSSCALDYIFDILFTKLMILQYNDQL